MIGGGSNQSRSERAIALVAPAPGTDPLPAAEGMKRRACRLAARRSAVAEATASVASLRTHSKFPWKNFPVTVPFDHEPCSVIILPVVHVERCVTPNEQLMEMAANFIAARRRRRLKKLPKLFQVRSEG